MDRRFNRRAYDARRVIGAALAAEDAGIDVEAVLRDALHDPGLTVAYPGPDAAGCGRTARRQPPAGTWTSTGTAGSWPGSASTRSGPTQATVRRAAALAAAELDNTRLRAELAQQVGEIAASRARLAGAQRRERRRIERDLHDGAQQSLLALAFELQSAQLNGDPERMRQALAEGATAAQAAVRELRDLANGLHPAALTDGGLAAALDDMARHSPVPLRVQVDGDRLDAGTEFTAWSVIGEAVVNAQKHAAAHGIEVDVQRRNGDLRLRVHDDGRGGANPDGPGLRGMRDRVEAAHGRLTVTTGAGRHDGRGGAAVRVVIADDSGLLRDGLANLLTEAGVDVVATAADAEQLLAMVDEHAPDIAVVDIRMPPTYTHEGAKAALELRQRQPGLGILLLSQSLESRYVTDLARRTPAASATCSRTG